MNKQEFKPTQKWHHTHTYTGPGEIKPLPITKYDNTLNSIWRLTSFWERVKFLFHGEITLRVMGQGQPPVAIVSGDIFGRKP